jgi:hypothetical protein
MKQIFCLVTLLFIISVSSAQGPRREIKFDLNVFPGTPGRLAGFATGTGNASEISLGAGLSLSGTTLSSTAVGTTNLTYTASSRLLESSTGTDVTLPLFTSTEAGYVPPSGGLSNQFLNGAGAFTVPVGTANLTYTASSRLLESSTGTDVTLPLFTSTEAGYVPPSGGLSNQFLNGAGAFAVPVGTTNLTYTASSRLLESSTGTDVTLPAFTTGVAGLVPNTSDGDANKFMNGAGAFTVPSGGVSGLTANRLVVSSTATSVQDFSWLTVGTVGQSLNITNVGSTANTVLGGGGIDLYHTSSLSGRFYATGINDARLEVTDDLEIIASDQINILSTNLNFNGNSASLRVGDPAPTTTTAIDLGAASGADGYINMYNSSGTLTVGMETVGTVGQVFASAGELRLRGNAGIRLTNNDPSNKISGAVTLVAGTATVTTSAVSGTSLIFLTAQNSAGTAGILRVTSRSSGVSFTITSTDAGDLSSVAWLILIPQ